MKLKRQLYVRLLCRSADLVRRFLRTVWDLRLYLRLERLVECAGRYTWAGLAGPIKNIKLKSNISADYDCLNDIKLHVTLRATLRVTLSTPLSVELLPGQVKGGWICHVVGFVGLLLMGVSCSLYAPTFLIDGENEEGVHWAVEYSHYVITHMVSALLGRRPSFRAVS